MGSVSYRKKGNRWHIRFQDPNQKEVIISLPGSLYEKTVEKKTRWYGEQMALGRYDPWKPGADQTKLVIDALGEYLNMNLKSGNWAENTTYKTNKNVLKRMLSPVADKKLVEVTPDRYQNLFEELPGGAYTKKGDRGRINGFLKFCHENKYIENRIKVGLPRKYEIEMQKETIKYLTWDQLNDICGAHRFLMREAPISHSKDPEFYCDLFWFMFYSLLRKEEVPQLRVSDLKGSRLRIHGKGRRIDTISLPPPALNFARKHVQGKRANEHLFLSNMNRPRVHFERAVDLALGKDHPGGKGFHQLRHGGIVHYISMGKPVQFVSKLARHRSVQVTLTVYADVIPDTMDQVFSDVEHGPVHNTQNGVKKG